MSVLLVDNEPSVTGMLRVKLRPEGWTILSAASGTEALELLVGNPDIEVLVSDFNMPAMDGAQLVDRALAIRPGLYSIVFTGFTNRDYAAQSLRVGADDYVVKDDDFDVRMAAAIRSGLQQVGIERMGRTLLGLEEKTAIFDRVFATLVELRRFEGCCVVARRAAGEVGRIERAMDLLSGTELATESPLVEDSAYLHVIASGQPYLPPVFAEADRRPLFAATQSIVIVPLPGEDTALGLEHHEPSRFRIEDLRFLQRVAHWVSLALANVSTTRERQRRLGEQNLLAHALLHEINNPLNNIAMLAQASDRLEPDDLADLITNVNRIRHELNVSLDRLRYDESAAPVQLAEVLDEAISRFHDYHPRSRATIEYDGRAVLPAILGRREMLIFAFVNLLQNGAEATDHRGRVSVRSAFVPLRSQIEVVFSDDGEGVPAERLARIFDYRSSSAKQGHFGHGLGLTKDLVERHGGEVSVASQAGVGTTFKVVLPVREIASEPPTPAESPD